MARNREKFKEDARKAIEVFYLGSYGAIMPEEIRKLAQKYIEDRAEIAIASAAMVGLLPDLDFFSKQALAHAIRIARPNKEG